MGQTQQLDANIGGVEMTKAQVADLVNFFNHPAYDLYLKLIDSQVQTVVDNTIGDPNQSNPNTIFQAQGTYLLARRQKSWPSEVQKAFEMLSEITLEDGRSDNSAGPE